MGYRRVNRIVHAAVFHRFLASGGAGAGNNEMTISPPTYLVCAANICF